MSQHTVFGDLRTGAVSVYRVQTQLSVYLVGFHEDQGRRFIVVRGEVGTDREHVVIRDSDPRVGGQSMFDVPIAEWPGKSLEVATMTSSTIVSVTPETNANADKNPWARPETVESIPSDGVQAARFAGVSESPRIVPTRAKGTHPAYAAPVPLPAGQIAKQVVVGGRPEPKVANEPPYPERHVLYAENIAALLRSISRRDRLYDDVRPDQRDRLRRALDDAASLLEQIRRRDRK